MAKPIFNLVRVCTRPVRQSIFDFARCAWIAGALCAASPAFADSSNADLSNDSGDDPTHPLGRIELLDRFTEAPGPGVAEGTTRRVDSNIPFARLDAPIRLSPQWELNFRVELPVVANNAVTPENPAGHLKWGFGNVLTQAWVIYEIDERWAMALGGQLIPPTSTNGVALETWEQVSGFVVRAMVPELSPGSYFAPQVRYALDFGENPTGSKLRQVRIAPTLNINFPHRLFFTLYPSPDIRLNYGTAVWGQTGRLFLPLNFLIGWKPTDNTVVSAELGIPIIKEFPAYTFKTQVRVGYLF